MKEKIKDFVKSAEMKCAGVASVAACHCYDRFRKCRGAGCLHFFQHGDHRVPDWFSVHGERRLEHDRYHCSDRAGRGRCGISEPEGYRLVQVPRKVSKVRQKRPGAFPGFF